LSTRFRVAGPAVDTASTLCQYVSNTGQGRSALESMAGMSAVVRYERQSQMTHLRNSSHSVLLSLRFCLLFCFDLFDYPLDFFILQILVMQNKEL
jgi:hypothetical protein